MCHETQASVCGRKRKQKQERHSQGTQYRVHRWKQAAPGEKREARERERKGSRTSDKQDSQVWQLTASRETAHEQSTRNHCGDQDCEGREGRLTKPVF